MKNFILRVRLASDYSVAINYDKIAVGCWLKDFSDEHCFCAKIAVTKLGGGGGGGGGWERGRKEKMNKKKKNM